MYGIIGFGTGEDKDGQPISSDEVKAALHDIRLLAAEKFGGCFMTYGQGNWIHNGILVSEPGAQLHFICQDERHFAQMAAFIQTRLNQQSVVRVLFETFYEEIY